MVASGANALPRGIPRFTTATVTVARYYFRFPTLPGGTPDPTNPAFVAARDHLLAQAGTAAVNDIFVLVTIGTLAVIALAFVLPDNIRQPATRSTGEPATPPALSAE